MNCRHVAKYPKKYSDELFFGRQIIFKVANIRELAPSIFPEPSIFGQTAGGVLSGLVRI